MFPESSVSSESHHRYPTTVVLTRTTRWRVVETRSPRSRDLCATGLVHSLSDQDFIGPPSPFRLFFPSDTCQGSPSRSVVVCVRRCAWDLFGTVTPTFMGSQVGGGFGGGSGVRPSQEERSRLPLFIVLLLFYSTNRHHTRPYRYVPTGGEWE